MAIHVGRNFCLAPFTQITFSPRGNYSPCPEIGGRLWSTNESVINFWTSNEIESLREDFLKNHTNPACNRCWDQEKTGNQSLRKRLFIYPHLKENILEFIETDYKNGPRQINLMTSNLCNLRCRVCTADLSVTYNKEGEYYHTKFNLEKSRYVSKEKKQLGFTDKQIQDIVDLSENLIRLEFYGGEPLLDIPTLNLLEKLIALGKSKDITLFYNTNGVSKPTPRHFELWSKFKGLEFNLSFDDIYDRFTYQRHPAVWQDALENLKELQQYSWEFQVQYQIICTISVFNVYYLNEILSEFKTLNIPVFLNTLSTPDYYDIRYLPKEIRQQIHDHLGNQNPQIEFVKKMLLQETDNNQWEQFKFWTRAKDEYRKESFSSTFPEFYKILNIYDETF